MMDRFKSTSSLRKSYSNEPKRTLSFVDNEDHSEVTTHGEDKHRSKTEKSVHFADEQIEVDDDSSLNDSYHSETSHDAITWLPSEHLYSEDTFIDDTETNKTTTKQHSHDQATSIPTAVSYGSSTFVDLETDDDDTDTEQLYSYTDSFLSSEVFSSPSQTFTYREWKDVTEIVKDIEELEESEFVTRADSLDTCLLEGDETEASETFEEEVAEAARQDFLTQAIRRMRLKEFQCSRGLAGSSLASSQRRSQLSSQPASRSKEERAFCQKMIQRCKKKSEHQKSPKAERKSPHPLYVELAEQQTRPLEFYGLNSALVERLKLSNFQHALTKKCLDLDKDILESEQYCQTSPANESLARCDFLSRMCSQVQRVNMEDAIQSHLIKMHPVTQFAQLVSQLPGAGEDAREILYEYKQQLENRKTKGAAEVT